MNSGRVPQDQDGSAKDPEPSAGRCRIKPLAEPLEGGHEPGETEERGDRVQHEEREQSDDRPEPKIAGEEGHRCQLLRAGPAAEGGSLAASESSACWPSMLRRDCG